jgi:hypothetical protein
LDSDAVAEKGGPERGLEGGSADSRKKEGGE